MLSAILITRNEAHNLEDCLASLQGLVDEIVVVDTQSSDETVSIAQRFGATVSQPDDWPGFGPQKNRALALATQPWVLSIDADERVTPELTAEINRVIGRDQQAGHHTGSFEKNFSAYEIPRQSWSAENLSSIAAGVRTMCCVYFAETAQNFQMTWYTSVWSPQSLSDNSKTTCSITAI